MRIIIENLDNGYLVTLERETGRADTRLTVGHMSGVFSIITAELEKLQPTISARESTLLSTYPLRIPVDPRATETFELVPGAEREVEVPITNAPRTFVPDYEPTQKD